MPPAGGTHLGPYEILSAIGAGGMSARGPSEREGASEPRRGWGPGAKREAAPEPMPR